MSGRLGGIRRAAPGRGRLKGRRILIVGGGQRIFDAATDPIGNGRAMSMLCAREGAHVAVADINQASAEHTVIRITAEGGRAFAIQADVTRESDVARMIEEAHRTMGGLDGMVLNVGTFGKTGLDGVSAEEWNRIYDVNVRGPMFCCRQALDKFETGGAIVFISSIAALKAGSQMAVYDSSKAALGGLMRNIAHLGARRGIRANLVYPGLVDTPNGRAAGAGPAVARQGEHAVRPPGHCMGDRLCRAVLPVGGERLHHRADARGRCRVERALRRECA